METKPVQLAKAPTLISVTLLGISTDVKLEQKLNAFAPMQVTLLGIVTEDKLEQL